ncbi:hypothetical protein [Mesorhizobium sp. M0047]|uniref:hypothetical protein n=1 Tax=Mesorhizobium sp. M0047 TaxID=2956859 RepID=UPI003339E58C
MLSHPHRAAARTTTLGRQPGSISDETELQAVDQPIATPELLSAVPLMALSAALWALKTFAAVHELDIFSRLTAGAGITVDGLAEALRARPRCCRPAALHSGSWRKRTAVIATQL